ncbi:hypothetical protein ACNKHS_15680 [Shigella flexneri]
MFDAHVQPNGEESYHLTVKAAMATTVSHAADATGRAVQSTLVSKAPPSEYSGLERRRRRSDCF